jgi:hypothetical protein
MFTTNKLITLLVLLLFACRPAVKQGVQTTIGFDQLEIDMGKLDYKMPETVEISFLNTGEHALVIYKVEASCGCTVPEWSKKPVKPGKKGQISVTYDSEFPGRFQKTIEVHYNGDGSPENIVIKGEVNYNEEEHNAINKNE